MERHRIKEKVMKANRVMPATPKPEEESRVNPKAAPVRFATKEEAEKAHRKVMKLHAGLLRRLAE